MEESRINAVTNRLYKEANLYVHARNGIKLSHKMPMYARDKIENASKEQLYNNSDNINHCLKRLSLEDRIEVMERVYEISVEAQTQAIDDNSPEILHKLEEGKVIEESFHRQLLEIFNDKILMEKNEDEAKQILSMLPSNQLEGFLDTIKPWCNAHKDYKSQFDILTEMGSQILDSREPEYSAFDTTIVETTLTIETAPEA